MRCIQVPRLEIRPPAVHKRKLKLLRERKMPDTGFFMCAMAGCPHGTGRSDAPRPNARMWLVARGSKAPTCAISRHPTTALKNPQTTLTVADGRPWPGGLAKGLCKGRPIAPETKRGIAFAAKTPPEKYAQAKANS